MVKGIGRRLHAQCVSSKKMSPYAHECISEFRDSLPFFFTFLSSVCSPSSRKPDNGHWDRQIRIEIPLMTWDELLYLSDFQFSSLRMGIIFNFIRVPCEYISCSKKSITCIAHSMPLINTIFLLFCSPFLKLILKS